MPYGKGVRLQRWQGTTMDMDRMMCIMSGSNYAGKWIGIEYEGNHLTEFEGIQASKTFLLKYAS